MRTLLFLYNPKLLFKYLCTGAKSVIFGWPKIPIQKRVNGVLFEFDFELDPVINLMRNPLKLLFKHFYTGLKPSVLPMYHGAYEPGTVRVMKKLLKKGDTFIDAGANIGYLSAIAMGLVGKTGQVYSFEPVPNYFKRLKNLATENEEYKVIVNECGLGEEEGIAGMDVVGLVNIGMSTMVPGLLRKEIVKERIRVPVHRLDQYIKEKNINNISLIKIDVEGFEFPVLKGLSNYFTNHRPPIICEINPRAYPLLGHTRTQLLKYMKKHNYYGFNLDGTKINITKLKEYANVMFLSST